jgi:hypothetical protein
VFPFLPPLPNPLPFCAVCSLWRSFVLGTPQFWKRVFVYVPLGISEADAQSKAADLVPWIERSVPLPLTLFIWYDASTSLVELGPAAPIVHVLNRYATRWETLYLQYARSCSASEEDSSRLFSSAEWSSLRRIHSLRDHSGPKEDKAAPWVQLTHLDITETLSYRDSMDILKGCPKLEWLSISVKSYGYFETLAFPIMLRDLSILHLLADEERISALVQSICLPSLQDISIHMLTSWQSLINLVPIIHLLTRSVCALRKLKISGSRCEPKDLDHLLAHPSCNSLTSLTISDCRGSEYASVDEEVIRRLTLYQDDTFCTRLRSLTLERCVKPSSFSALLSMVESRICSNVGQSPVELLGYLYLQVKNVDEVEEKLDDIIKRSGMQYEKFSTFTRFRIDGVSETRDLQLILIVDNLIKPYR